MAQSAVLGCNQRNRVTRPVVRGCFMTTNAASGRLPDLRGLGRQAIASVTAPVAKLRRFTAEVASVFGRLAQRSKGFRRACSPFRTNGAKLAAAMASLEVDSDDQLASRGRSVALAFLNGVVGHDLAATGDPLALTMQLRRNGRALKLERRALALAFPDATGKLVVLVHGLCMSDLQWSSQNHDHGAALAGDLGYTPVYVSYNSGLHISTNGKALAGALEALVSEWPVDIEDFAIIGYSMGGLVARSACRSGEEAGHVWRKKLRKLVFLARRITARRSSASAIGLRPQWGRRLTQVASPGWGSSAAQGSPTCDTGTFWTKTGRAKIDLRAVQTGARPSLCPMTSRATPWRRRSRAHPGPLQGVLSAMASFPSTVRSAATKAPPET